MKKKNILMMALSLCLIAIIAVGGTLAYFTDNTDTMTNVVTTGNVDIVLYDKTESGTSTDGKELVVGTPVHVDNDKTKPQTGIRYEKLMPGDVISKRVSVDQVDGMQDCYVAVKVSVSSSNEKLQLSDIMSQIQAAGGSNGWEYFEQDANTVIFYLTHSLDTELAEGGTSVTEDGKLLFTEIAIPGTTWGNEVVNSSFDIQVKAAAVQAKNLVFPDYGQDGANETLQKLVNLLNGSETGDQGGETGNEGGEQTQP